MPRESTPFDSHSSSERVGGGVCPRAAAFRVATISTLITLAVSLIIASDFGHWYDDGFGLVTELAWLPSIGAPLTCMLIARHVAGSAFDGLDAHLCDRVQDRHQDASASITRGSWYWKPPCLVFLAKNLLFFYVAFEFTLVPMYFLIAGWGSNRASASIKFFLYTFTGSMLTWRASPMWLGDLPMQVADGTLTSPH